MPYTCPKGVSILCPRGLPDSEIRGYPDLRGSGSSLGGFIKLGARATWTIPPPTVPLPTVPRELSMLSTDTAESIASLEQDARAKIQDYGSQSRQHDKLVKSGLLAFLTWLPEAGKTSLARDVIEASSEQQLYDAFLNLLTGLASPSKYTSLSAALDRGQTVGEIEDKTCL